MLWVDWPLDAGGAGSCAAGEPCRAGVSAARIHDRFETIQNMFSDISSRVQENLAGVRVVRAYVQEQPELAHFERVNRDYIHENLRLARISGLFNPLLTGADRYFVSAGPVDGRHAAGGAQNHPRQLRDVQHLHGNAGVAHDRDGLGGEPDAARPGFARADRGVLR